MSKSTARQLWGNNDSKFAQIDLGLLYDFASSAMENVFLGVIILNCKELF
jgi:hypothetical protein